MIVQCKLIKHRLSCSTFVDCTAFKVLQQIFISYLTSNISSGQSEKAVEEREKEKEGQTEDLEEKKRDAHQAEEKLCEQ